MERNRWDTALRCLEIAVHPNTGEKEIIAAINGFRRTAGRTPLGEICRELAGVTTSTPNPVLAQKLDGLSRENLALRQRVDEFAEDRNALLRRLQQAEQRASALGDALQAAQARAAAAELRLDEQRSAYALIAGSDNENAEFRRALAAARRNLRQPIHEPVPPFQAVLDNALGRPGPAPPARPAAAIPGWTA